MKRLARFLFLAFLLSVVAALTVGPALAYHALGWDIGASLGGAP